MTSKAEDIFHEKTDSWAAAAKSDERDRCHPQPSPKKRDAGYS
jgi:hypothetical protein